MGLAVIIVLSEDPCCLCSPLCLPCSPVGGPFPVVLVCCLLSVSLYYSSRPACQLMPGVSLFGGPCMHRVIGRYMEAFWRGSAAGLGLLACLPAAAIAACLSCLPECFLSPGAGSAVGFHGFPFRPCAPNHLSYVFKCPGLVSLSLGPLVIRWIIRSKYN